MTDAKDLLALVLPSDGWICIASLTPSVKHLPPVQQFFKDLDEAIEYVEKEKNNKRNIYFGLARFKSDDNRTQHNAKYLRSFFLDLDVRPEKKGTDEEKRVYLTEEDALDSLHTLCKKYHFPKPSLVSSGRGFHAYWPLTEDVTPEVWKPVADALKKACADLDMPIDYSVPADCARILRMPGTVNYNHADKVTARVEHISKPVEFSLFQDALAHWVELTGIGEIAPSAKRDGFTKGLQDPNAESWFVDIIKRKDPCAQIIYCIENSDTLTEPMWRGALSVAWVCQDRKKAIRAVSAGHPDYSFDVSYEKASKTAGPYTCNTFASLNPSGCNKCPHKKTVRSPISLGKRIVEAPPPTPDELARVESDPTVIPEYPFPYFRGQNGGVYRRGEGDEPAQLIYENDFYVVNRIDDIAGAGEIIAFRLHTPRDGLKNFTVPLSAVGARDKLKDELLKRGMVLLTTKQMDGVMHYIGRWVKDLQMRRPASKSVKQFGWTNKFDGFVLGDTEYTANGARYSPPSETTMPLVESLRPTGELSEWRKVIDLYNNESQINYQFCICTAFGSLLYPFTDTDSGLLMAFESPHSGHGKTYMGHLMNSIYGHPKLNVIPASSTENYIFQRLGVWNHMGVMIDEVTHWGPDKMANFAMLFAAGRGKGRMQASANLERVNHTSWRNISFMTSNELVYTSLLRSKAVPIAEMMRIYPVRFFNELIVKQTKADNLFRILDNNYGLAGPVFIDYCIKDLPKIAAEVRKVKEKYIEQLKLSHQYRFWASGNAATMVGGLIASKLGLHGFDMQTMREWSYDYINNLRKEVENVEEILFDSTSVIGEILAENFNSTVVATREKPGDRTLTALVTPKANSLNVRIDSDTHDISIRMTVFNEYCRKRNFDPNVVIDGLQRAKKQVSKVNCRIAAGTTMNAGAPVKVLRVNMPEIVTDELVENLAASAKDDADASGSNVSD